MPVISFFEIQFLQAQHLLIVRKSVVELLKLLLVYWCIYFAKVFYWCNHFAKVFFPWQTVLILIRLPDP